MKGVPRIKSLYLTLRGSDSDCLDLPSVIELLRDMDKRIESLSVRPKQHDPPSTRTGR